MIIAKSIGLILVCSGVTLPNAHGQQHAALGRMLDSPARLHVRDVPLGRALDELTRRSGVSLAYSPSLLHVERRVSCSCMNATVGGALRTLLDGSSFDYREGDGQVLITPRVVDAQPAAIAEPLGAIGLFGDELADDSSPVNARIATAPALVATATISGNVTADGGSPVLGVLVTSTRTRLAATTDIAGNYRIVVPTARVIAGPDTLIFERLGYTTRRVPYQLDNGDIRVNAVLGLQPVALNQIVVTGTAGNQERKAQGAVVGSIAAADIVRSAPINNVTQLLQARLPGISVTESSGVTGAAARINIRGASSINLSNQPLVFIDGVRIEGGARGLVNVSGSSAVGQAPSALNDVNPEDIESIEVVKGPAAATLYGADASAGVIQIITKKGRVGSRTFTQEITTEYGTIDPNFTMPGNYAHCTAALIVPTSTNPLCRGQQVGALIFDDPAERVGAFRDGSSKSLRYNVRGGGENYGFFGSFGMTNEDGTTRNNLYKQRSGRVNFTFAPSQKLTFDATYALSRTAYDLPRSDQDNYSYFVQSILGSPLTVRDDNAAGTLTGGFLFGTTSLESLTAIQSRVSALRSTPSLQVRYSPFNWLTNRLTVGADVTQGNGFQLFPKNDFGWYPGRVTGGSGDVSTTQTDERIYTVEYMGNIENRFGSAATISSNLSFGSQYIRRVSNSLSGAGLGLITNASYLVTSAATSAVGQGYGESKSLGLFAQEQLGYRDRLFVQFGLRADRNSAFGNEVGTFYLPKVGFSYVLSEEPYWQALQDIIPTFRLRAAYGTTGRSPSAGASLQTFLPAKFVTDAGVVELGIAPGNPGNPNLKPERGKELEFGFDAAFLDNRLGGELTYYHKKSTDVLVSIPVAPSAGFGSNLGNLGEVLNRGIEFAVRATPVSTRNVNWDLSLGGSTLHNEILSLGTAGTFINNFRAFVEGRPIAAWWAYRVRSVDEANSRAIVSDTAEFSGNQLPTFQANLSSSLTIFRSLRLNALLERKSGYTVYNLTQEFRDRSSRSSGEVNLPVEEGGYSASERLRRLGPYFTESTNAAVGVSNVKDPYLQKGDHVRLREVSATYTLPVRLANRFRAASASITLGGRNVALWLSDYEGADPDVLGTGPEASGLNQLFNADVFTTPPSRRWFGRLNLQF